MQGYDPYLFRIAEPQDLDAIYAFSKVAGLTNLPPDRDLLRAHIQQCQDCVQHERNAPEPDDFYFFVLENIETKTLLGCCALFADVGNKPSFYTFHHHIQNNTLLLNKTFQHTSEMAALYLSHDHRTQHMGAYLSRARYMWVAAHPERFHHTFIAEMRGRIDKHDAKPFWDFFSHQFFPNQAFEHADLEVAKHHTQFIFDQIPHTHIDIDTLDKRAQACIGITHVSTRAAMALLIKEGFVKTDDINVFDGGPILKANTDSIRTIRHSKHYTFLGTKEMKGDHMHFIATTKTPFLVSLAPVMIDEDTQSVHLSNEVVQKMKLEPNDTLLLSAF